MVVLEQSQVKKLIVDTIRMMNYSWCDFVIGVKNPITVASRLLSQQRSGLMSLGRIPPM